MIIQIHPLVFFLENFKIVLINQKNSHIIYPEHIFAIIVPSTDQNRQQCVKPKALSFSLAFLSFCCCEKQFSETNEWERIIKCEIGGRMIFNIK